MATISTRAQFKDYCLRRLGFPVIQINVDDDKVDDSIDDALAFFNDYHWDGVEKIYMKHKISLLKEIHNNQLIKYLYNYLNILRNI